MQYKIPVQIENEDPIFLWLWLRQLMIIMIGWGAAFMLFDNLREKLGPEIAAVPAVLILAIVILIAVFKHSWMTFVPFFLSLLRNTLNPKERRWDKTIDSFQPIDIWYIVVSDKKAEKKISFETKLDKIKNLEDKINKI